MLHRISVFTLAAAAATTAVAAELPAATAKFISLSPNAAPQVRMLGESELPQVGEPVPDGPRRVRVPVSDEVLEDYAHASLLALKVYARYDDRVRQAQSRYEARMIAASANGELAEALDRSGVMDHSSFLRMTRALNADEALAQRARDVAERVLAR